METENIKGIKLIVCFDDKAKGKSPITLENPSDASLKELNDAGYGIFETANSFFATQEQMDKSGFKTKRHKEFLSCLNEVFADLDVCKDSEGIPEEEREARKNSLKNALNDYYPPSVYVITKNGLQPRWWLSEAGINEATQQKYVNITKGIIEWSILNGAKGDSVYDVTRVLRKPGYYHHKSEPYLITEEKGSGKTYTLDEVKEFFWYEPPTEKESNPIHNKIDLIDIRTVVIDVWKEKGSEASFDKDDHLIIDGKQTATFRGRLGDNYIATSSSDYPAKGNAITYISQTLGIDRKQAYKWLCNKYKIKETNEIGDSELEPITAKDLCDQEFPPAEWMIKRLIPENQITVISGPPGVFKTMTSLDWGISVSTGKKAYGYFETIQSPVLLISEDGDHKRIAKKRIGFLTEIPSDDFHLLISSNFKVVEKAIGKLLILIKKHGIKFIIFDSFRAIMPSDKKENESGDVREVINRLRPLTNAGATILIIHHDRKKPQNNRGYTSSDPNDLGEMMSGSVDIRGAVDCHLAMGAGRDKKENQFYIIITQTKCREDELLPAFKVLVVKEKDDEDKTIKMELQYAGEYKADNAEETLNKARDAILEYITNSSEKYVWRQTITQNKPGGFAERTLEKALKTMEEVDKSITSLKGKELGKLGLESKRKYYYIKESDSIEDVQNLAGSFKF